MYLSLIIPIYNVEKYIIQCLQSVVDQLPENVEVVLVNDGSPDASMSLVNHFLENLDIKVKSQIKIINQKNMGLSGARNTGIEYSIGSYIAFLDSDDILLSGYFDDLLNIIDKFSPDIVEFDAIRFGDNGEKYPFYELSRKDGIYEVDNDYLRDLCNQSIWYAWKRIYKRELFANIRYPVGVNFEDAYTTPYLFIEAKTIYLLNRKVVGYRNNLNSITNTRTEKNLNDLKNTALFLNKDVIEYNFLLGGVVSMSRIYISDIMKVSNIDMACKKWKELQESLNLDIDLVEINVIGFKNKLFLKSCFFYLLLLKIKNILRGQGI